ncbi:MAG: sigma-70 family RNA polymerase sigma factor [Kiritimatiellae bacterium]|nr:sigma-70 family RNA polymerase sigma factor [Kiritimatiellia bacterium]
MSHEILPEDQLFREFARYRMQVGAMAYGITRDFHLAEDVIQEVAVVLARRRADYDPSRPLLPWVLGITRRKALETMRARKPGIVQFRDDALDHLQDALAEHAEPGYIQDRLEALARCLRKLSPDNTEILERKYCAREQADHIARVLGKSRAAVNSILQRLRAKVMECVERQLKEAAPA